MFGDDYDRFSAGCRKRFPAWYERQRRERQTSLWLGLCCLGLAIAAIAYSVQ